MTTRTQRIRRAALVAVAAALVGLPTAGFGQQASFEDTTTVVVVEVPVNVTRDGDAVRGLTKENFTLLDGGKEQEILSVEQIDLSVVGERPAAPQEVPIAARRHFLMLFDLMFSTPASIVKARGAGRELLASLHPTDLVGVAVYSGARGVQFVLGFTSDRRQVELALETLGVPDLIELAKDPLRLYLGDLYRQEMDPTLPGLDEGGIEDGADLGRIADAAIRAVVERAAASLQAEQESRVIAMTRDLSAMAEVMAGIEGHKHVVYLSEGFDSNLLLGDGGDDRSRRARESGQLWNVNTEEMYGSTRLQNDLEQMLEALRRAGCIVQAVDIGGMRAEGRFAEQVRGETGLFVMAKDTGGEFFRNFNNLGEAMDEMLTRTSVTYLLSFQPRKIKLDGKYHRLKVKLEGVPRGTSVHHRLGYYAPKPFAETGEQTRQLDAAELILSGETRGVIAAHVLATPFPVPGQKAYVPLMVEIDGANLLADLEGEVAPLELYVYALDAAGTVHDFATQSVGLDLTKLGPQIGQGGVKFWAHLDLAAGEYSARVMVRNVRTGSFALREIPVRVPDFAAAEPFLLTPLIPDPEGKWALVREEAERRREVPYPFFVGETPYVPAAGPIVPARGRTEVYLRGFYLGADEVRISGKVTDVTGSETTAATLQPGERVPAEGGAWVVKTALETAGLEPGIYTLTVTVRSAAGQEHASSIRFLVNA